MNLSKFRPRMLAAGVAVAAGAGITGLPATAAFADATPNVATSPSIAATYPATLGNGGDLRPGQITVSNPSAANGGVDYAHVRVDFVITGPDGLTPDDLTLCNGTDCTTAGAKVTLTQDPDTKVITGHLPPDEGEALAAGGTDNFPIRITSNPGAPVTPDGTPVHVVTKLVNIDNSASTLDSDADSIALRVPTLGATLPSSLTAGGAYSTFSGALVNNTGSDYSGIQVGFAISPDPTSFTADDLTLQYDATGAGAWTTIPLSQDPDSHVITGEFGPADGFPMGDGYNGSTPFRIKANEGAPHATLSTVISLNKVNNAPAETTTAVAQPEVTPTTDSNGVPTGTILTLAPQTTTVVSAPGVPANVTASTTEGSATVVASWDDPADNGGSAITSYDVELIEGDTVKATVTGLAATVHQHTFGSEVGVTLGHTYTVAVRAHNAVGASNYQPSDSVIAGEVAPDAPTDVTATAGNGTVSVTWTAPADDGGADIDHYVVQLLNSADEVISTHNDVAASATSDEFTSADDSVVNGTAYHVTVQAVNEAGTGAAGTSDEVTPVAPGAPDAPTNVDATAGDQTVSVTWTAPSDNGSDITGYTVKLYNGDDELIATHSSVAASATSDEFTSSDSVVNGTTYYVTVAATNAEGTGEAGTSDDVTPSAAAATAPGAPTSVDATPGDQTVDVTWAAPTDDGGADITGYTVKLLRGETEIKSTALGASATSTSFTAEDGVSNRVTYTVSVTATNSVGTGDAATDTATPVPSSPFEELNALGLAGTNRHLYFRLSTSSGYGDLGGVIYDSPGAAVDPDNGHTYVVVRGNTVNGNNLYIRSDSQGYAPFVTGHAFCKEPAAAVADGVLAVACRGSNNHLYVAKATIPGTGLPHVTGFTDYGGILLYGPSVVATGDSGTPFIYEVVGNNHHLFNRSDSSAFVSDSDFPMTCFGTVSESLEDAGDMVVCANSAGALQFKMFTDQAPDGVSGTIAGKLLGRPAVAVNGDGTADVYVIGTNGKVYSANLGSDGSVVTGFHFIGGAGTSGGITAVSLSVLNPDTANATARSSWHRG